MKEKTARNKKIIADKKNLSWREMEKKYKISIQAMKAIVKRLSAVDNSSK